MYNLQGNDNMKPLSWGLIFLYKQLLNNHKNINLGPINLKFCMFYSVGWSSLVINMFLGH